LISLLNDAVICEAFLQYKILGTRGSVIFYGWC